MSLERLLAGEEGVFREAPAATTALHILKSEHSFTLIVDGESIISVISVNDRWRPIYTHRGW